MIRRMLTGSLGLKAAALGMVGVGLTELTVAVILMAGVVVAAVVKVLRGASEQFWEPEREQYARHWESMVWANTRWDNGGETPQDAIERLAGPWKPREQR